MLTRNPLPFLIIQIAASYMKLQKYPDDDVRVLVNFLLDYPRVAHPLGVRFNFLVNGKLVVVDPLTSKKLLHCINMRLSSVDSIQNDLGLLRSVTSLL